nr:hypothetical protein [Aquitalea sp.]
MVLPCWVMLPDPSVICPPVGKPAAPTLPASTRVHSASMLLPERDALPCADTFSATATIAHAWELQTSLYTWFNEARRISFSRYDLLLGVFIDLIKNRVFALIVLLIIHLGKRYFNMKIWILSRLLISV